jgi:hypothetical protein
MWPLDLWVFKKIEELKNVAIFFILKLKNKTYIRKTYTHTTQIDFENQKIYISKN